jgi:hypothetical protein
MQKLQMKLEEPITGKSFDDLELARAGQRGGSSTALPPVTTYDQ